jgi:transcription factor C subunit 3
MGQFFNRPLEVTLDRIAKNFRLSQPPRLLHLALVRDTAQNKKAYHYKYYTYANFQKLVDRGETSWENVEALLQNSRGGKMSKRPQASYMTVMRSAKEKVDEYGFRKYPASRFSRPDGCATLAETIALAKFKDIVHTSFDPVLRRTEDGRVGECFGFSSLLVISFVSVH